LANTFGHIAHFDRAGFFDTFFTSTAQKVHFLEWRIDPWTEFGGDPAYTYCDVERAVARTISGPRDTWNGIALHSPQKLNWPNGRS
jgi:hypothetical protein